MNKNQLEDYIAQGREIEFRYKGKKYSITYVPEDVEDYISFCEFYKETTEVKNVDELANVSRDGVTVLEMLTSLDEDDIWIY